MNADAKEAASQQDTIDQMVAGGWKLGDLAKYDRKLPLYTEAYRFLCEGLVGLKHQSNSRCLALAYLI